MRFNDEMTDEIAFDIGKGIIDAFYDIPVWIPNVNDEKCSKYIGFYKWEFWNGYGTQCSFAGSLKEDLFKTIEHKRQYIKGRLSSYSAATTETSIVVGYANSFKSRDRFGKFAQDIIFDKYDFIHPLTSSVKIIMSQGMASIPATPNISITADKEIIQYLTK
jgi:hypothetical protein